MSDSNGLDWDVDPVEETEDTFIDINSDVNEDTELVVLPTHNPDDEVATLVQNDASGAEVVTEINFSSPPLNREEAVEITERIKSTTNVLYVLVQRAHAGKAYKALGYDSFEAYIRAEFNFSKVYAYRLLQQASFIEAIEERVPEGTEVRISEPVSKKLKHVLPELLEEVTDRTAGLEADAAGDVIEDIIRERREQAARDEAEAAEFTNNDDSFGEENEGNFGGGNGDGSGTFVDDFEGEEVSFEDDDDDDLLGEDSADIRRKFDKLYNLYTGLKNINSVGEGEELIDFLSPERWDEFIGLFDSVIPWLTDFNEKLKKHRDEQGNIEAPANDELDDTENTDDFD